MDDLRAFTVSSAGDGDASGAFWPCMDDGVSTALMPAMSMPMMPMMAPPPAQVNTTPGYYFPPNDVERGVPSFSHGAEDAAPPLVNAMAPPPAIPSGFFDDLLSSSADEGEWRLRMTAQDRGDDSLNRLPPVVDASESTSGEDGESAASSAASQLVGTSLPPSTRRAVTSATASRLLQLENNYERKKKRAKINRKDLNSRFQELMDILHLKEDRKLNRAKILEKAIDHIYSLMDQVEVLTAQVNGQDGKNTTTTTAVAPSPAPPVAMTKHTRTAQTVSSRPMYHAHKHQSPWAVAPVPVGPMMWVPCPMMPSQSAIAPNKPNTMPHNGMNATGRPDMQQRRALVTTGMAPSPSLKRARNTGNTVGAGAPPRVTSTSSALMWMVQELPGFLAFCDAWSLTALMCTCKEVAVCARADHLWQRLCAVRWAITSDAVLASRAHQQWKEWHATNRMPHCPSLTSGVLFSSGQSHGIHVWGVLARRSNGLTTRSVLLRGKATAMQVVEIHVVVQNLSNRRVYLTDDISVAARYSDGTSTCDLGMFLPFSADSGAHLIPHLININSKACVYEALAKTVLLQGDMCTMSVFLHCDGFDLEQEFLERAKILRVAFQCDVKGQPGVKQTVQLQAPSHRIEEIVAKYYSFAVASDK
ncbi:TPA: hypothetical protein N0F65_002826 [Lagenidium giganteum]|uniref:BHLH domain-containing protein n=1 Tax=Lagenidium giganteum TaxID=4803 RepID=A0AAV2Z7M3_9STRA|nr:TPA: hypothetical protein N0F65_002826 [Lagenidium giganteum]